MPTDSVFSISGANRFAILATSNRPNTTAIEADANGPNSTAIQATSVDPSSTAIQATSGSPTSAGVNPTTSGACIHAISNDNLPGILAENTIDGNAITAKGLPALDAFDNPPPPSVLTIPPGTPVGGTPSGGGLSVGPLVEGFVAVIQAHATVALAAGINATSENGPGAVVSTAGATGLTAAVGLSPDSNLMGAGHAIAATTNVSNAAGLFVSSVNGPGVEASSPHNTAIQATSQSGFGIEASSGGGTALVARSSKGPGAVVSSDVATGIVAAVGLGTSADSTEAALVPIGHAIAAVTNKLNAAGLFARSESGAGVEAVSNTGPGILAESENSFGVDARSIHGTAVRARSSAGVGLSVEGFLEVSAPAIGAITAQGGETSLQVHNPAATAKSTILLTPLGNPGAFLWINTRAAGSFTIGASQPLPGGLIIQFLIIN